MRQRRRSSGWKVPARRHRGSWRSSMNSTSSCRTASRRWRRRLGAKLHARPPIPRCRTTPSARTMKSSTVPMALPPSPRCSTRPTCRPVPADPCPPDPGAQLHSRSRPRGDRRQPPQRLKAKTLLPAPSCRKLLQERRDEDLQLGTLSALLFLTGLRVPWHRGCLLGVATGRC